MLIIQPYLKDIMCILLGCVFVPRQQTLLDHADNNLIGRFALIDAKKAYLMCSGNLEGTPAKMAISSG
ncbi:hypothetical protein SOJ85_000893 [Cronobacter turicensis]|nr:hypothetical protein [Cronobacter turicensis]